MAKKTPKDQGQLLDTGLSDLAAQITAERATAAEEARKALLKDLGFESNRDLKTFITTSQDAAKAQMTELEKREAAVKEAEAQAAAAIEAAKATADNNVITAALLRAGVGSDVLDLARPLVTIDGDITAETADAAVKALKDNKALASLFGASGVVSGTTEDTQQKQKTSPMTAYERGMERAKTQADKGGPSWT